MSFFVILFLPVALLTVTCLLSSLIWIVIETITKALGSRCPMCQKVQPNFFPVFLSVKQRTVPFSPDTHLYLKDNGASLRRERGAHSEP